MRDSCQATWYDGRTSQRHEVTLTLVGDTLAVQGLPTDLVYPLAEIHVDPPLGRMRRALRFPDGATADTDADDFLEQLSRKQGKKSLLHGVHCWEKSLKRAVAALLLTVLLVFCFLRFGVPYLAAKVAFALPAATEEIIGRETLQILDKLGMEPSALPAKRRQEVKRHFEAMIAGHPERKGWRLEFRASKAIGANAFALPSGIVVVTDAMVKLAENDEEIIGVLAHEVGHVTHRHALRHLLQNSVTALLVATLTGDIVSASSLAATMPTVLVDAKYSRDFEREADLAAVRYLKQKGIPVRRYAEILARLDAEHYKERDAAPRLGELFDSHPLMLERVQAVMAADRSLP